MTERSWDEVRTSPERLLGALPRPVSERKLRLLLVALARRGWPILPRRHRRAVEVAERFADGRAREPERAAALLDVGGASATLLEGPNGLAARALAARGLLGHVDPASRGLALRAARLGPERAAHCDLVREVFVNPFRPVAVEPDWRSDRVLALARAIQESGEFDALPILGDALQDEGCTDAALLAHLARDDGHVRGCWALDLLLDLG